jgi:methionyl-tRNA formyltransferase
MVNYLFVGYREWAINSHYEIGLDIPLVSSTEDLISYINQNPLVKYIFFVGWSEIINDDIINNYVCLCIHPSKLPLYRGGSPIQNQIIDGIIESGVTLFRMNKILDSGPIIDQRFLSLSGSLEQIFTRLSILTTDLIRTFIYKIENNIPIVYDDQEHHKATFYKRRKPDQSEITFDELKTLTAIQLYNKIRSLEDPYPNAFIKCADGKKIYIKKVAIE